MTWQISKDFAFSASHQLAGLRDGHPCGRLHGHNYQVRVTLTGDALDPNGFVLDYGDLKPFGTWLDNTVDHQHLNDVIDVQPSAENLARWMHHMLGRFVALPEGVTASVAVSETPKTWATYTP